MDNPPISIISKRAEIERIKKEAASFGYSLDFETPREYRDAILEIRKKRDNKPPCYKRLFEVTAPQCRICEVAKVCGEVPEIDPITKNELEPIQCKQCQVGRLCIECRAEKNELVDYACTTLGCENTLLSQSHWKEPSSVVIGSEVMKAKILGHIKANGKCTLKQLNNAMGVNKSPEIKIVCREIIEELKQKGVIRYSRETGFALC
jgi:hypothetical protein